MSFSDEDDINRILAGVDYTEMKEAGVKAEFNQEGNSRLRQSC